MVTAAEDLYGDDILNAPDGPDPSEYADLNPDHPEAYQHNAPPAVPVQVLVEPCPECGVATQVDGTRNLITCPWCWWSRPIGPR